LCNYAVKEHKPVHTVHLKVL